MRDFALFANGLGAAAQPAHANLTSGADARPPTSQHTGVEHSAPRLGTLLLKDYSHTRYPGCARFWILTANEHAPDTHVSTIQLQPVFGVLPLQLSSLNSFP